MSGAVFKCSRCGGDARRGFIAERGEHSTFVARWIEGEPVNAEFLGIKGINVDVHGRQSFAVRSLRCDQCGFLELFAV